MVPCHQLFKVNIYIYNIYIYYIYIKNIPSPFFNIHTICTHGCMDGIPYRPSHRICHCQEVVLSCHQLLRPVNIPSPRKTPHGLMEYRYSFLRISLPYFRYPSISSRRWCPSDLQSSPFCCAIRWPATPRAGWCLRLRLESVGSVEGLSRENRFFFSSVSVVFFFFFFGEMPSFFGVSCLGVCNVFFFHVFGGWPGKKKQFLSTFRAVFRSFSCWGGKIDE